MNIICEVPMHNNTRYMLEVVCYVLVLNYFHNVNIIGTVLTNNVHLSIDIFLLCFYLS